MDSRNIKTTLAKFVRKLTKKSHKISQANAKDNQENPSILTKLPAEVSQHVLSFVEPEDLSTMQLVSKNFGLLAADDHLWKMHVQKMFDLTDESLAAYFKEYGSYKKVFQQLHQSNKPAKAFIVHELSFLVDKEPLIQALNAIIASDNPCDRFNSKSVFSSLEDVRKSLQRHYFFPGVPSVLFLDITMQEAQKLLRQKKYDELNKHIIRVNYQYIDADTFQEAASVLYRNNQFVLGHVMFQMPEYSMQQCAHR